MLWIAVWTTTLTIDLINPLRVLMVWAVIELLNTLCFTAIASTINRDLCLVDIAIYNAAQHDKYLYPRQPTRSTTAPEAELLAQGCPRGP